MGSLLKHVCPECNRLTETVTLQNGNSHKTKYYCRNPKCKTIEVKYRYTTNEYGERFIEVRSVKREPIARPQPLNWLTVDILLDNPSIGLMTNKELKEKGYFE